MFADPCDDFMDEELAAILGQDIQTILPTNHHHSNPLAAASAFINPTNIHDPAENDHATFHESPGAYLESEPTPAAAAVIVEPPHEQRVMINSSPIILNFGLKPQEQAAAVPGDGEEAAMVKTVKKSSRIRPPSQTYDHIIAERKRRELLSQRFVILSGMVPGLKKLDKTSVLGDAIDYLKKLQERVKMLEEQTSKQTMESVMLVKRSHISATSEEDEQQWTRLPEIEAKVCNNQILIKIHCKNQNGMMKQILGQVDKFNLLVLHSNVMSFGNLAVDITILAEMLSDEEHNQMANEILKAIRSLF